MARLVELYKKKMIPQLMERLKYENIMEVPRIDKIVINMGVSIAREDIKVLDEAVGELAAITGQKPIVTRAKKSISNFKLRKGMPIGCKVTLHGAMMYEFLDRLINVALPRVRDFRGVSRDGFDGQGNYNLGIQEHTIFPEINIDKVGKIKGLNVSIVTTAKNRDEAYELLNLFGMPFRKT
ncbi:50S ribosomal protein L5 [bacterium]|nr:50S ribosomal protein L5 [bacterium]NIN92288.1 50S ribosomal protein L5 [bacterium]NIO18410.1 50S ribosomal protein L5 [bacterium]NIO73403.1 50S ribosomal protein L5 [bacterium]